MHLLSRVLGAVCPCSHMVRLFCLLRTSAATTPVAYAMNALIVLVRGSHPCVPPTSQGLNPAKAIAKIKQSVATGTPV